MVRTSNPMLYSEGFHILENERENCCDLYHRVAAPLESHTHAVHLISQSAPY